MNKPQYEVYETDDGILSGLELPNPCQIRVEIQADRVRLFIGQRDMDWERSTGKLLGAGTTIEPPRPEGA